MKRCPECRREYDTTRAQIYATDQTAVFRSGIAEVSGKDIEDRDGIGSWLVWLNHDPVWKEMRTDRRWKDIQKRAGW